MIGRIYGVERMSQQPDPEHDRERQARTVSIVIAGTMVLWMLAQWIGGSLGLPDRYVFLFDMFALAGFAWAMIVTWQIWRKRRDNE